MLYVAYTGSAGSSAVPFRPPVMAETIMVKGWPGPYASIMATSKQYMTIRMGTSKLYDEIKKMLQIGAAETSQSQCGYLRQVLKNAKKNK